MSESLQTLKTKSRRICEYCDKEFCDASALNSHRMIHTGQRPFSCNLCHFSATQKSNLQTHIRSHLHEKPFKCPELGCDYSASSSTSLKYHRKSVHLQDKSFGCPVCEYKCVLKSTLPQHMTIHEKNAEKPFKCELCPFKAKTNGEIKRHVTHVHSEERKFKCPEESCEYASKAKSDLKMHIKSHGEKTLACSYPDCDFTTNTEQNRQRHTQIHIPDSETRFKCRLCDYSSHFSNALTVHMRTHTKETPYKCKIQGCQYQAKQLSRLNQHRTVVHEKIRPFKCPFSDSGCSYAAAQKINLEAHKRARHRYSNLDSKKSP